VTDPQAEHVSPEDLQQAAIQLTRLAEEQGVRAAVAGGFAGLLLGVVRGTGDLDMTADGLLAGGVEKRSPLTFGGESIVAPNGVPTDWILRADDVRELYEEALALAEETGLGYRRVRPEHWIAMKLFAGRERDEEDIIALARLETFTDALAERAKALAYKHLGGQFAIESLESLLEQAKL